MSAPGDGRILLFLHDLGESGRLYSTLVPFHVDGVSEFFFLDLRGHGRSAGARGHFAKFDRLEEDLRQVLEKLATLFPGQPIHLAGVGLGASVVLGLLLSAPLACKSIASLFLAAPITAPQLFKGAVGLTKWTALQALAAAKPDFQLSLEVDPQAWVSDPLAREMMREDRLCHHQVSARAALELMAFSSRLGALESPRLSRPVFFLVPFHDPINTSQATLEFIERARGPEKEFKMLRNSTHALFLESALEEPFEELNAWIRRHGS